MIWRVLLPPHCPGGGGAGPFPWPWRLRQEEGVLPLFLPGGLPGAGAPCPSTGLAQCQGLRSVYPTPEYTFPPQPGARWSGPSCGGAPVPHSGRALQARGDPPTLGKTTLYFSVPSPENGTFLRAGPCLCMFCPQPRLPGAVNKCDDEDMAACFLSGPSTAATSCTKPSLVFFLPTESLLTRNFWPKLCTSLAWPHLCMRCMMGPHPRPQALLAWPGLPLTTLPCPGKGAELSTSAFSSRNRRPQASPMSSGHIARGPEQLVKSDMGKLGRRKKEPVRSGQPEHLVLFWAQT